MALRGHLLLSNSEEQESLLLQENLYVILLYIQHISTKWGQYSIISSLNALQGRFLDIRHWLSMVIKYGMYKINIGMYTTLYKVFGQI